MIGQMSYLALHLTYHRKPFSKQVKNSFRQRFFFNLYSVSRRHLSGECFEFTATCSWEVGGENWPDAAFCWKHCVTDNFIKRKLCFVLSEQFLVVDMFIFCLYMTDDMRTDTVKQLVCVANFLLCWCLLIYLWHSTQSHSCYLLILWKLFEKVNDNILDIFV